MGILNVTPDSFSDGGHFLNHAAAVERAHQIWSEGADLIDIGGESTRPGAERISLEEERQRVLPVLERIKAEIPACRISLDTTKAALAAEGVEAGAVLINDVSGGTLDPEMLPTVAVLGVPICLMHLPVLPEHMGWSRSAGGGLDLEASPVPLVVDFLRRQITAAFSAGVASENILIDPGFGFGKSPEQNLDVLRSIQAIKGALGGLPLLIGPSRKSTIARLLGPDSDRRDPERIAGTAALTALAAAYGADIVRVHDVAFMARVVRVADAVARRS